MGTALSNIMNASAGRFVMTQMHLSDIYQTSWGNQRMSFYGISASPHVWTDGVISRPGVLTQAGYQADVDARLAVPTDVSITFSSARIAEATYRITSRVAIDAGGVGKTMRIHVVQLLDQYPVANTHWRNCVMQGAPFQTITVNAGETQSIQTDLVLSGASWLPANRANIRVLAIAQATNAAAPSQIYQVGQLRWPFNPADLNADGLIDIGDLAILLSNYGRSGDVLPGDGDIDRDLDIDIADLAIFLASFGG